MTDKTNHYSLIVFLLWAVVIAVTTITISNILGITGRKAVLPPVVAISLYMLLVIRLYRNQAKFSGKISSVNLPDTTPGHTKPASQPVPSRQFLNDAEKREWLDKFLSDMQNK